MCGIFGELCVVGADHERRAFAETAAFALRHRGPDGSGLWQDDHCQLGHQRLSIIDLSTRAAQPMLSASRRSHLVFNGEIYNYLELRSRIDPPVGGFRSTSDSEVLLELLDQRGLAALQETIGMFAIALWRPADGELWLIRDRLGKKPLYWARTRDGRLRFASELGAVLADGAVARETTLDRLAEYLQLGYVAAPRSGIVAVQAVPPGHVLRARVASGKITERLERWWDLPPPTSARKFRNSNEFNECFDATLRNAVEIRMRSDVPLGAFLSGGIDSSVISLLSAQAIPGKLKTFTVDFDEAGWSEGPFAAEVARHIGAEHESLRLSSGSLSSLGDLASIYGDLHGDSSAIPTVALCRAARERVTVAVAGDGGDELLGGYTRYASTLATAEIARRVPAPALAVARRLAGRRPMAWVRGATRVARLFGDPDQLYPLEMRAYVGQAWPMVLSSSGSEPWRDPVGDALRQQRGRPPLFRLMACDAKTYLPEDILVKVDRASMAFGLEVRAPLLDHRLFELVMQAAPEWLASNEGPKRPLRQLFGARLPSAVFRRAKMGFGVPLVDWLRRDPSQTRALLDRAAPVAGVLNRAAVRRLLLSHHLGLRDESLRIWRLLMLAAWFELWRPNVTDARR